MEAIEVLEVADSPDSSVLEHSVNDSSMMLIIDVDMDEDCHTSFRTSPAKNIKLQNHWNPVSDHVDPGKRAATYGKDFTIYKKKDGEEAVKRFKKCSSSGLEKKEAEVLNLSVKDCDNSGSSGVHGQVLYESDGSVGNIDSQANLSKLPLFGSIEKQHRTKMKGNESAIDMQATAKERLPRLMTPDTPWRNMMCDKPVHNGIPHQFSTWESKNSFTLDGKHTEKKFSGETFSSFASISSKDNQKERYVHSEEVPNMKGGQKGFVHTNSVFPVADIYGKIMNDTRNTNISSISGVESEETRKVGDKEKTMSNDITAEYIKKTILKAQYPRECWEPGGHATLFAGDEIYTSFKDTGRGTRHDRGKASINSFSESDDVFGTGDMCSLSGRSVELESGDADPVHISHDNPCILNQSLNCATSGLKSKPKILHGQQNQVMGNKNRRSVLSHFDECSVFPSNNFRTSCIQLQPSGQATNERSGLLSSQEEDCREYDSLKQRDLIESDEILARKLQEEFDRELEGYGRTEERGAAMEHLDEDEHDSPLEISYQPSTNAAEVQSSDTRHQQRGILDGSAFDLEMSFLSELRRGFSTANMNSEMKAKLFEALEFAFQKSNTAVSVAYHPETDGLNEDDYEIVMAHNEDNHAYAASEVEINSLPHSVIQGDDSKEACAVCLELPSAGDVIRHLPCLHKFHKECIDTWLRKKATCPICKSQVF